MFGTNRALTALTLASIFITDALAVSGSRTRSLVKRLKAVLIITILSSCLTACFPPTISSDPIDLRASDRAVVPEMEGMFWALIEGAKANADFTTIEVRRTDDGHYAFTSRENSGTGTATIIDSSVTADILETAHEGIYLVLTTAENRMDYTLLLQSHAGTWAVFPFIGELKSPLEGKRERYLGKVAARHGLRLRWNEKRSETWLEGKLDVRKIRALFSDPAFLGGLRLEAEQGFRMFPMNMPVMPDQSRRDAWMKPGGYDGARLTSAPFAIAAGDLVRSPMLSGQYEYEGFDLGVAIVPQDDGRYLLKYPDAADGKPGTVKTLRLLPTSHSGMYLGLMEGVGHPIVDERAGSDFVDTFEYSIMTLDAARVTITPLRIAVHDFSFTMDSFTRKLREDAARRQGLSFTNNQMAGDLNAASVRTLFEDPQFQTGVFTIPHDPEAMVLEPAALGPPHS